MAGKSCTIMLDPKGDRGLFARTAAEAHRHRKPFAMFLTAFPQYSASFNPLHSAHSALEVAAQIRVLMPDSGDPFFTGFPMAFVTRIAEAQQKLHIPWTLERLYEACVIRNHMEDLIAQYLLSLGCYRPVGKGHTLLTAAMLEYEHQGLHDATADALINFARWPREHYQKITATLIPTFDGIVNGPFAALLSPNEPDLTWQRIVQEGMVVYIGLSSLMFPDTANRIARTQIQSLLGFLGRRYAYEDPAQMSAINVVIDEFGDVLYPGIVEALTKVRGANVRFILASPSRADADAKLGHDEARRLFDNMTQGWFRLRDNDTAADTLKGESAFVQLPKPPTVGLGYAGVGGLSGHTSAGLGTYQVPVVRPGFFKALPIGEAFFNIGGFLYKVRFPLLTPVPQATLDELGLTAMWESMDPHKSYEGDVWTDPPPSPTVPPERWLPAPSQPVLPLVAARRLEGKSTKPNSSIFSRVLQRILTCWRRWGQQPRPTS